MPSMPAVWVSLKKSLHCDSIDPQDVHQPRARTSFSSFFRGTRRSSPAPSQKSCSSPCSIASNDTTTQKILQHAKLDELNDNNSRNSAEARNNTSNRHSASDINTVEGRVKMRSTLGKSTYPRMFGMSPVKHENGYVPPSVVFYRKLTNPLFQEIGTHNLEEAGVCIRCAKRFSNLQALETHFITEHGVGELKAGDPTRNVVEIIFRSSWADAEVKSRSIERVFKINNSKKTIAAFEEYRESVKKRASKKHPRCMADGNEVLRFHGTNLVCSLADTSDEKNNTTTKSNGASPALCNQTACEACNIIRSGFPAKEGKPISTASTSYRAHNKMESEGVKKRAILVCRVIAGRVHKPLCGTDSFHVPFGFDSVAGNIGSGSRMEELLVSNSKALLPCFLIVYS